MNENKPDPKNTGKLKWLAAAIVLTGLTAFIIITPIPFLFYHRLPLMAFFGRSLFILLLSCALCFCRLAMGPSAIDRIIAVNAIGITVTGLCAILAITTGRPWYIDVSIAWMLQNFIITLALAKHVEGKRFDE